MTLALQPTFARGAEGRCKARTGLGPVRRAYLCGAIALVVASHAALLFASRQAIRGSSTAPPHSTVSIRTIEAARPAVVVEPREEGPGGPSAPPPQRADSAAVRAALPEFASPRAQSEKGANPAAKPRPESGRDLGKPQEGAAAPPAEPGAPAAVVQRPAAPAGLPPAPDYLLASRMDPRPGPLSDIVPEYPDAAEQRSGSVVLRLLLNEAGGLDDVAVVRAAPPGVFEEAALAAFRAGRFSPGFVNGVAVKSQLTVEVEFTPLNRGPRVSGRGY